MQFLHFLSDTTVASELHGMNPTGAPFLGMHVMIVHPQDNCDCGVYASLLETLAVFPDLN